MTPRHRTVAQIHPDSAYGQKIAAQRHRDKAYDQRDEVISALSKQFESHLMPTSVERVNWKWTVCIHLPTGQVAWNVSDESIAKYFSHLQRTHENHWDRHRQAQRTERLLTLPTK